MRVKATATRTAIRNDDRFYLQIFGGVFSTIIIIVFSFYFCVLETGVDDFLRIVTPKSHQHYILGLWRRSQHKIGLWMQGQLILALTIGILIYLTLTIFQVPHALVLAVVAAACVCPTTFGTSGMKFAVTLSAAFIVTVVEALLGFARPLQAGSW